MSTLTNATGKIKNVKSLSDDIEIGTIQFSTSGKVARFHSNSILNYDRYKPVVGDKVKFEFETGVGSTLKARNVEIRRNT